MQAIRLTLLASLALAGCAAPPTAPSVFALPGRDKPFEQFTADDNRCRQYAGERERSAAGQTTPSDIEMQRRYDTAYVQCMYAAGHRVPVAGVFASQPPGTPPPPPAAPPGAPPAGSAPAPAEGGASPTPAPEAPSPQT